MPSPNFMHCYAVTYGKCGLISSVHSAMQCTGMSEAYLLQLFILSKQRTSNISLKYFSIFVIHLSHLGYHHCRQYL